MPACVQIVRKVEDLIVGWFGIVNGVRVPSSFSLTIAICSRLRTIENPSRSNARITLLSVHQRETYSSGGELRFGNKGFEHWGFAVECIPAKCFNMKINRRFNVGQCFLIGIALPDHDAL